MESVEYFTSICSVALDSHNSNKQYPTPVWRHCGMQGTPNKVMNGLLFLVRLKFARFLPRIKAKTLSSVCNVPRDKANIENKLGNLKIITTFALKDTKQAAVESAEYYDHRALFPERAIMLFSIKAGDVVY